MQIPHDEDAIHAVRMRIAGPTPVMLTEAWVRKDVGRGVTAAALMEKAM